MLLAGQYGPNIILLLKKLGIMNLFINELNQENFAITKPDPRYINQIASTAGFNCCDCIVVGDRIDKDIIPAKQNGMGTIFIKSGIYKKQEIRTPDEIPDLILEDIKGLSEAINKTFET